MTVTASYSFVGQLCVYVYVHEHMCVCVVRTYVYKHLHTHTIWRNDLCSETASGKDLALPLQDSSTQTPWSRVTQRWSSR